MINRGINLVHCGEVEAAINEFEMAFELNVDPTAAFNLACCHALLEDGDLAITFLEKAVELGLSDPSLLEDSDLSFLRSPVSGVTEHFNHLQSLVEQRSEDAYCKFMKRESCEENNEKVEDYRLRLKTKIVAGIKEEAMKRIAVAKKRKKSRPESAPLRLTQKRQFSHNNNEILKKSKLYKKIEHAKLYATEANRNASINVNSTDVLVEEILSGKKKGELTVLCNRKCAGLLLHFQATFALLGKGKEGGNENKENGFVIVHAKHKMSGLSFTWTCRVNPKQWRERKRGEILLQRVVSNLQLHRGGPSGRNISNLQNAKRKLMFRKRFSNSFLFLGILPYKLYLDKNFTSKPQNDTKGMRKKKKKKKCYDPSDVKRLANLRVHLRKVSFDANRGQNVVRTFIKLCGKDREKGLLGLKQFCVGISRIAPIRDKRWLLRLFRALSNDSNNRSHQIDFEEFSKLLPIDSSRTTDADDDLILSRLDQRSVLKAEGKVQRVAGKHGDRAHLQIQSLASFLREALMEKEEVEDDMPMKRRENSSSKRNDVIDMEDDKEEEVSSFMKELERKKTCIKMKEKERVAAASLRAQELVLRKKLKKEESVKAVFDAQKAVAEALSSLKLDL
eukprot:g5483.t1